MTTLYANAWSSGSSDGDAFEFSWSTDNNNYSPLFAVSSTGPANQQSTVIPGSPAGTVYIRVRDTDQTQGHRDLDTVFIDHLFIRTENAGGGSPPTAPDGLGANAVGHDRVDLSWSDQSDNESGFNIERSADGANFSQVWSTGAGETAYSDTGLSGNTTYWYRINAFNLSGTSGYSNTAQDTTGTPPPPPAISLSLDGYKVRGSHVIDLTWSGATSGNVDIYRDGGAPTTVANDGEHTDETGNKGSRTYSYQVCEAASSACSDIEFISF
jgi:hypothetical protein